MQIQLLTHSEKKFKCSIHQCNVQNASVLRNMRRFAYREWFTKSNHHFTTCDMRRTHFSISAQVKCRKMVIRFQFAGTKHEKGKSKKPSVDIETNKIQI